MKIRSKLIASLVSFSCSLSCSSEQSDPSVTTRDEPAGENCEHGGQRIDFVQDDETKSVYACDGSSGDASVDVEGEPAGENCENGGKKLTIHTDSSGPVVTYVCNGEAGSDGEDGDPGKSGDPGEEGPRGDAGDDGDDVAVTLEPEGENCPTGGVKVQNGTRPIEYICNVGMRWRTLTTDARAKGNEGYVVDDATLTLTLPASDELKIGEVLQLIHRGNGAVSVKPAADQTFEFVRGRLALPTSWTKILYDENRSWSGVAMSADGSRLIAVERAGYVYTSATSGASWTETMMDEQREWGNVASSADGRRLLASGGVQDPVRTSSDFGVTWTDVAPATGGARRVAISANGLRWFIADVGGRVWYSNDEGASWDDVGSPPHNYSAQWSSIACSADGEWVVAAASNGFVYTTPSPASDWIPRSVAQGLAAVASSEDGQKLVASTGPGFIYTSTNAGGTWTQRAETRTWSAVASSADGERLVALEFDGGVSISIDSGVTWTAELTEETPWWSAVASSATGQRILAASLDGALYSRGGTGSLVALPGSFLELTYTGAGRFTITRIEGNVEEP